ncbi:hypothetical protein ACFX1R_024823 [Malus domestica]
MSCDFLRVLLVLCNTASPNPSLSSRIMYGLHLENYRRRWLEKWRDCYFCLGFRLTSAVDTALCKEGKAAACSSSLLLPCSKPSLHYRRVSGPSLGTMGSSSSLVETWKMMVYSPLHF